MKRSLSTLLIIFLAVGLSAQHIGVNLRIGVEKELKLGKKLKLELGQQLQFNPEVTDAEDKYSNLFNEIYLFPDSDDQEDDDSIDEEIDDPDNALDDSPKNIAVEWRSASGFRAGYALLPWLKLGQSYTLNVRRDDLRHSLASFLEIEKYLVPKKFMLEWRLTYQQTSRKRESGLEWQRDLVGRFNSEWAIKKNHRLYAATSVNSEIDKGNMEWDRLRLDSGVRYRFRKIHQFDLGYRFQQKLTGKKATSHGIVLGYTVQL
ncbi:MAG: hypothetical protein HUU34_07790 [Saprospiraceae bacterium]|jgi:hypothetical protein|nr:hypothetical protein [Saprospiraceae bacterium]